jgi:hypothetical protein
MHSRVDLREPFDRSSAHLCERNVPHKQVQVRRGFWYRPRRSVWASAGSNDGKAVSSRPVATWLLSTWMPNVLGGQVAAQSRKESEDKDNHMPAKI